MTVLGIETSTEVCSVCVWDATGVRAERSIIEARVHSEKLLTLVREVFLVAGVEMRDIAAIATSIGPGSFTGLRIGLSSAKGLCYALEKPLAVVSTFDAIANSVVRSGSDATCIAVALDAKQGEHYIGIYSYRDNRVEPVGKIEVLTTSQGRERLRSSGAVLVVTDSQEVWRKELDTKVRFGSLTSFCGAEAVARLGMEKVHAKQFADLASVEPMYLKDFVVKAAR